MPQGIPRTIARKLSAPSKRRVRIGSIDVTNCRMSLLAPGSAFVATSRCTTIVRKKGGRMETRCQSPHSLVGEATRQTPSGLLRRTSSSGPSRRTPSNAEMAKRMATSCQLTYPAVAGVFFLKSRLTQATIPTTTTTTSFLSAMAATMTSFQNFPSSPSLVAAIPAPPATSATSP